METEFKFSEDSLKIIASLSKWNTRVSKSVSDELNAIGQDVRNNIMENMRNTKLSSKFYQRTKSGKRHYSSEPGSPPAIDSGRLVGSFEVKSSRTSVEVGTNVVYAKWLEAGTKPYQIKAKNKKGLSTGKGGLYFGPLVNHPGLQARPFIAGGLDGIDINKRLNEAVKRGFGK